MQDILKTPNKVTENMFETNYEQKGLRLTLKLRRTPVSDSVTGLDF